MFAAIAQAAGPCAMVVGTSSSPSSDCSGTYTGTFGSADTPDAQTTTTTDRMWYQTFTTSSSGNINRIGIELEFASDNNFIVAIYSSDGQTLIAQSSEVDPGVNTQAFYYGAVSGACLNNSTNYVLAVMVDYVASGYDIGRYAAGSGPLYYFSRDYASGFPSTFTPGDAGHSTLTDDLSIRADYN